MVRRRINRPVDGNHRRRNVGHGYNRHRLYSGLSCGNQCWDGGRDQCQWWHFLQFGGRRDDMHSLWVHRVRSDLHRCYRRGIYRSGYYGKLRRLSVSKRFYSGMRRVSGRQGAHPF